MPHGHWKTTTFVGVLRLEGMTAPMVLDGADLTGARLDGSKGLAPETIAQPVEDQSRRSRQTG